MERLDSHSRGTGMEDTQVGEGLALLLCKGKTNMGSAAITADSGKQISVPLGHCLQSGNWLESFSYVWADRLRWRGKG